LFIEPLYKSKIPLVVLLLGLSVSILNKQGVLYKRSISCQVSVYLRSDSTKRDQQKPLERSAMSHPQSLDSCFISSQTSLFFGGKCL